MNKKFYQDRRQADVKSCHEFSRSAAQSVMLINGGAATAVLASKSSFIDTVFCYYGSLVAFSLCFFAVGVLFGAFMNFAERMALHGWGQFWEKKSDNTFSCYTFKGKWRFRAAAWHWISVSSFMLSSLSFLVGCSILACAMMANRGSYICFLCNWWGM
ncbi:hypothetical protein [Solidesulfovibrio sp.]